MHEKRQHLRTTFLADVKLIHPSVGERCVQMRDLSDGGVFLFCGNQTGIAIGDQVRVQALDVEGAPLLSAQVVRVEALGVGLRFL